MAKRKNQEKSIHLYEILNEYTDADHKLSMPEILRKMEERGVPCQREVIYDLINNFNQHQIPVHFSRAGKQGYWMEHIFTPAEAMILIDSLQGSLSLSVKETQKITNKIQSLLSNTQKKTLHSNVPEIRKTDNQNVIQMIDQLLPAIQKKYEIDFQYFDITIQKEKQYRHNNKRYHSVPYAIVSNAGRYYCVMYSDDHQDFAGFRIDRMDHLVVRETQRETLPFNIDSWMRASFNMFKGEPTTIRLRVHKTLSNAILEQFGDNLILQGETEQMYQLALRTGITPTLTSWILQYPNKIIVDGPQELIDQLIDIGKMIQTTYMEKSND